MKPYYRCQVRNIVIGSWRFVAMYPDSILAKCYFPEKKLIWEFLEDVGTGPAMMRMKRKIVIEWSDILSLRALRHSVDATEILELELSKPPKFFMEKDPQPFICTKWDHETDQDFTQNQASICRRHTLQFSSGVLLEMMNTLESRSGNSFWSQLANVPFPSLSTSLYFEGQTLTSNVNDSQGFGNMGLGEGTSYMETQFRLNDGRQINPFVQSNQVNEQVGRSFLGPEFYNRLSQGMQQIRNSNGYANLNDKNNNNSLLLHQQPQGEIKSTITTHHWNDDGSHMTSVVEENVREEETDENLEKDGEKKN